MALDVEVLRDSFELVLSRRPNVTHLFYEELFRRYPEARSLFGRHSMEAQEQMLAEALVAAVANLEDAAWLQTNLGELGSKHAEYGVTEEMYGWVGEALLATFAEAAGSDWTPELERAWGEAYQAIAALMLAGYPQAQAVE
jgi:hemoglobin-like flavoprotein